MARFLCSLIFKDLLRFSESLCYNFLIHICVGMKSASRRGAGRAKPNSQNFTGSSLETQNRGGYAGAVFLRNFEK